MTNTTLKLFAILGCPVKHSFSPQMHNEWFNEEKLACSYLKFEPNVKNLGKTLQSLKFLGFSCFNIMLPYKTGVVKYLDAIDNATKK